jgi:NSS family neurotransmitter:Na+ symporter
VFAGVGILSFYAVIMGWTGKMLVDFIAGTNPRLFPPAGGAIDTSAHFGAVAEGTDAIVAHLIGMALTIVIIAGGIQKGIERVSLILMPLLFALIVGLAVWAATLTGAGPGYSFYLTPKVSAIFQPATIAGAASQAFFSLSLGMGAMITYASYLKGRHGSLPGQAAIVCLSDTAVAFVGGLVTFPIIFHFGLQAEISASTIGALFIAVPRGILEMGDAGRLVGIVFFSALYIAAITSAMSLLEVAASACIDSLGWTRRRAALVGGVVIAVAGIPSALSTDLLGFLFAVFGEIFLVFGGLMLALIVGWAWHSRALEELSDGFPNPAMAVAWIWLLRTFVPVVLVVALYFSVRETLLPAARSLFGAG